MGMAKIADRVVYGNFYTVDEKLPRAEAVAIADGRFVYVGDQAGARDYVGEGTQEQRFEGGVILPGLGEGHGHVNPGGTEALFTVHLKPFDTLDEHLAKVRAFIAERPEIDIIQGAGWVPTPEIGQMGPTADMLDGLTDKPIVLADIGHHSYWVNRAAMDRLGIDRDTPDVSDGIIVRDGEGNPTGFFREGAMDLIKPLTTFTVEQYREAVLYFQDEYLPHGMTLVMDPIVNWDGTDTFVEACHHLDVEGRLRIHVFGAYQVFQAEGHVTMAEIEHAAELRERSRGAMFDLSNIKIQVDGVIGGNPPTAYMKEPYSDPESQAKGYVGAPRFDMETLTAIYARSHELGFTVHAHAIGDAALAMALDAMEAALERTGPHGLRDAVTHLQVVDPTDIDRMARLGVVASTDPFWFIMDTNYFAQMVAILGDRRAEAQLPMRSFFDAGVVASSASDYPVENPAYPLIGIQNGVLRQAPGQPDTLHGAAERVSVEQMLQASSLNVAYQLLCDDRLGSITVGKEADLVVLGEDLLRVDAGHIQEVSVLATMVGGTWQYLRP